MSWFSSLPRDGIRTMQWTTTPSKPSLADDFLDDWRDREASFQQADAGLHKNPLRGRKRLPQLHQDFRFRRDGEGNQLDFGLGLEPRHQRSTFDNSPASSIPPSIQWRFDTTTLPHLPPPSRSPPPFSQYSPDVFENLDFDSFLNIANDSDPHGPDAQSTESRAKKREFECPHEGCDKSYSRAEHLYRHQLNHNPKSIYHCDFPSCGRSFIRQDLCARHKDRHTVRGSQLLQKDTSNPKSTVEMQPSPFRGVPSSSKYLVDESSRQAGSEIFSQTLTGSQKKKRSQQGLQRRSDLSSMYISYTISQDKSLDTEAQERTRLIAVHGRKSPVVSKRCKFYHEALEPCDKPTAAPSEFSPLTSPSVISSPYSTVADIDDGGVGTDQGDAVVVQQRHAQQQHMMNSALFAQHRSSSQYLVQRKQQQQQQQQMLAQQNGKAGMNFQHQMNAQQMAALQGNMPQQHVTYPPHLREEMAKQQQMSNPQQGAMLSAQHRAVASTYGSRTALRPKSNGPAPSVPGPPPHISPYPSMVPGQVVQQREIPFKVMIPGP